VFGLKYESSKYVAAFQRVGVIYEESIILLGEYARHGDWKVIKEKAIKENLLKKGSSVWIENILRAVKHRFFADTEPLPSGRQVSKFILCDIPKSSKMQVLYQYVCQSDPLVDRLITGLVEPILARYGTSRLTKQMYFEFLDGEARNHLELKSWSSVVYSTWQRKFFVFLRRSGIMEKAPSVEIRKPVVRVEPFAFFLYGLIDKGISGLEAIKSPLWKRYFMTKDDVENAISSAQERGWIEYRRLGGIVELTTRFRSLEDWLDGALG